MGDIRQGHSGLTYKAFSPRKVPGLGGEGKIAPRGILGDSQGRPSERYDWTHYGRVMTERRTELGYPYPNPLEPTLKDIIDNETIARKELNYDR